MSSFCLTELFIFPSDIKGTPINKPPVLGYKDLNLFKLFRLVYHQGGCDNVSNWSSEVLFVRWTAALFDVELAYAFFIKNTECSCPLIIINKILIFQIDSGAVWKQIYMDLGIPILNSAASYNVKTAYRK